MGEESANISENLFVLCMKGRWSEVVERYERDERAPWEKITESGDTALHVAVNYKQDFVVARLVRAIFFQFFGQPEQCDQVLQIPNERGNTALHFAASIGSVYMCRRIASASNNIPSLLSSRNCEGETPLFLAALNGRKEAFLTLHYIWDKLIKENPTIDYYANCRRSTDGETILHRAIAEQNFDLAFQIIHLYEDLVNSKNLNGSSPLHILASKPFAFRSGGRLGLFERILYHGIIIEYLEVAEPSNYSDELYQISSKDENCYPENCRTCMGLLSTIKKSALVVISPLTRLYQKCPLARVLNSLGVKMKTKPPPEGQTGNQRDLEASEMTVTNGAETNSSGSKTRVWSHHQLYPDNYKSCANLFKTAFLTLLVIFGKGLPIIISIRPEKQKHVWSAQIMDQLLRRVSMYEYDDTGNKPRQNSEDNADQEIVPYAFDKEGGVTLANIKQQPSTTEGEAKQEKNGDEKNLRKKMPLETPILIAAKHGVTEMVEKILELFPLAIRDTDAENKNIVLLAVENRQSHLYLFLLRRSRTILNERMFRKVDNKGNSALHLAAKLGDIKPWLISGEALQMHWEIKWFLFVREYMPPHFFPRYNNDNKTPEEIFSETHKHLHKSGMDWLSKTSESCSLVAALIATVAFATSTTVPGGVQESTGIPTLEDKTAFHVFAISSLIALSCSVTAVVLFLTILTSRYQENDFGKDLPRKLIFGLTSLFVSITSMMISFYAGHFFMIKDKLKYAAFPVYAVICLPVTLYTLAQFSLYFDLIWATFKTVPQSSYRTTLH